MKIQNLFNTGIIDKDSQGRFVDEGKLIDAENFFVNTIEGSGGGVGKNALGNALKTAYNITGGHTIGHGVNTGDNKVYNLIKGTNYDYIIEYDSETSVSEIVAQSTTGILLNFNEDERITNVDIIVSGIAYNPITKKGGNLLAFSGDSNPPRILNIERAKTWNIDGFSNDDISVMKPSPIFAPVIAMTTSVDGVENNFIKNKFINIAYRYKYLDGYYSSFSSWTKPAFEPNRYLIDYQSYENNGMVNLANAINISFNTGVREVSKIELCFKENHSNTIYVIDSFDKDKLSWGDNTTQTFQLSKSKILKVLSEEQWFRDDDKVPLSSVGQSIIGNRLGYANYIEGRDIDVDIDFNVELVSTNPYIDNINTAISNYIDTVDYSNEVDFESFIIDGGSAPVNQMNYSTNEIVVDITGATSAIFEIKITPKAGYSTILYDILIVNGSTVITSFLNLTGIQTKTYTVTANSNIKIYVNSINGIFYDCNLTYSIINIFSTISKYIYNAVYQLTYAKSVGTGTNLSGDTILKAKSSIDLSSYSFIKNKQIRINFELESSLVIGTKPSITFFYYLTNNYSSVTDFITNSSFKQQLEDVFSLSFKNNFISNAGILVSYTGFKLSYIGNIINIITPKVVYSVNEPSGVVTNKNEFFLTKTADFITVSENSFTSLHSNRDAEVCIFYLDAQGRKTTPLTVTDNTIYIPAINSVLVNKLKITLNNPPPSWAKYYKFGIKQTKKEYEIIYGNEVYAEGEFRWIKLVGENKNKVSEGDVLIVKSDYAGALEYLEKVKVLEIVVKEQDFIKDNKISNGQDLIETPGLYLKIKQGNFDISIDEQSFTSFIASAKRRYASESDVTTTPIFGTYESTVYTPFEIKAGSQIRFYVSMKAYGSISFENIFEKQITASKDYIDIKECWDEQIGILDQWQQFVTDNFKDAKFNLDGTKPLSFSVRPNRNGTASRDIMTDIVFDINFAGGTLIFETEPIEDLSTPFYETPETYTISNGLHQFTEHILNDAFDCYSFGNGVESYKIQDSFLGKSFIINANPKVENKDGYKKENRYSDITYSGVYNSNTNINRLNEFNLFLANFKDDIDKSYGPIMKIKGTDTNLEVYQEDKCSKVYYGKDLLYNADGTSNLTKIESVLGVQEMYGGEYGISYHPESFDEYAFNSYLTDTKRGIVLKKSNNGLFEISSQGMNSYFKKLFRDNIINKVIGEYDQYHDVYVLNIKMNNNPDDYVTWIYSDKYNGWLGRLPFNPEDMCRVNGKFLAFFNGEIYEHNQATGRNTFFGVEYPSTWTINFPQEPSMRKNYKTIEIEGTDAWDLTINTDLDAGYINAVDFNKEEGVFKAHTRLSNTVIDTSLLSVQGIGNCTVAGLVLSFGFDLSSDVSIGDDVRNLDNELVGTILSKTPNSLTLNAVANIVSGDFVMLSKPQSANVNSLLGYHLQVSGTLTKNTKTELFAVNAEVVKSFN